MKIVARGAEPGRPRGLIRAWVAWERMAHRLWPTIDIPNAPYGLLRMRLKSYQGEPLVLPGAIRISRHALIGELHCDNEKFLNLVVRHRINPYRACREDLRSLAAWVQNDGSGARVEAFFGRTMLAVGGKRLGFTVRELPANPLLRLERFFMVGLLLLYTERGFDRLTRGTTVLSYPREVWISRTRLVALYGARSQSQAAAADARIGSAGAAPHRYPAAVRRRGQPEGSPYCGAE